jgi:formylmethanofuran dehydrogenase subunit E
MYLCGMMAAMPATFWDRFFDSEYRQRTDIGALQDREDQVALDVGSQDTRIAGLERQLHELQMTLGALMKVMSEMGQLDPRAVKMRVEAELEAMRPPAPAPRVVNAHPHKERVPDVPVKCARCGATVPSSRTTIPENGTLCDQCVR